MATVVRCRVIRRQGVCTPYALLTVATHHTFCVVFGRVNGKGMDRRLKKFGRMFLVRLSAPSGSSGVDRDDILLVLSFSLSCPVFHYIVIASRSCPCCSFAYRSSCRFFFMNMWFSSRFLPCQGETLPIDIRMLADLAEKCHAYAKALHYKVRSATHGSHKYCPMTQGVLNHRGKTSS